MTIFYSTLWITLSPKPQHHVQMKSHLVFYPSRRNRRCCREEAIESAHWRAAMCEEYELFWTPLNFTQVPFTPRLIFVRQSFSTIRRCPLSSLFLRPQPAHRRRSTVSKFGVATFRVRVIFYDVAHSTT